MAFNPNAVFISPSSLADFEKCPQLYYYRNVFRKPNGLKIQIINPPLALGQAVHDTLEQFLKLIPAERNKEELLKMLEIVWSNLKDEKGGYVSETEEKEYHEKAVLMLERFWKHEHFKTAEKFKIPDFPKVELGNDLILTGKLDWIEKDNDTYHLIDFKTGKNEEREDSKQLPIYAVLISNILGSSNIKTSYWYLDHDDELTSAPFGNIEETTKDLTQRGNILKLVRQTNSFRCKSGGESCWACKDMLAVAKGKGKLVSVDYSRKQEIYILPKDPRKSTSKMEIPEGLPF
ncbi:hypothetical protein COT44_00490 [Candidatus Shapirobacteria bacterium CG08_land_8_20_14_0_20_39_18]|uniref:PD-(D/E)XK endonuclease-like domain-containing protein n=1 Tax=Candidatus Shapirobacteria bacterium CG08_land_8_20_14_0_20_39_18 TaxID=1974883 RepID=A0A2M6XEC6_9BACT|nr:MAG: hypothetical protein COT44_00490 [Candidatus Shapirobacteria bacterium CG08_land_8_20_14_0_20_39_18]PIY66437.1 MAG: hypothetical protein COY91_00650 [Candidatus Shapirobacteria bacterium CG_4_10_14_0_8_um_filter_39_15]PJE68409.1 MAG: hypothetical protein COU94_02060 [Candidatus Shapirobacteria bacterium CG10_big_fil_rev_8_21_14_0_10_38_8]